MNPLLSARKEWEVATTSNPKNHPDGKKVHIHDFRKYGQAIAWLKWNDNCIEIAKFEKLPGACRGAGTQLIEFLKSLADKYQVRLFGRAIAYDEFDPPIPEGPFLTQEQLETWYEKHGFKIYKSIQSGPATIWYPDVLQTPSDACQPLETK